MKPEVASLVVKLYELARPSNDRLASAERDTIRRTIDALAEQERSIKRLVEALRRE